MTTYTIDMDHLIDLVGAYDSQAGALADGWTFDNAAITCPAELGEPVVVYSRGMWRRGVVTKIGRLNARVAYTTRTAVDAVRDPRRYCYGNDPQVSNPAVPFANIFVRATAGERA